MPDIAIDPALAEDNNINDINFNDINISIINDINSINNINVDDNKNNINANSNSNSNSNSNNNADVDVNLTDNPDYIPLAKSEGEPRLSHARLAVPNDPSIKPYGCNSPRCIPTPTQFQLAKMRYAEGLAAYKAELERLQSNTETATEKPLMRHPSLDSLGVSFAASRDLLDHLRDAHQMRQKGEVHVSQLTAVADPYSMHHDMLELGEDGKMFRCALVACQRTWKNANGLQYHCLTSVTAEEHNIDTVSRRRPPVKRKLEGSVDSAEVPATSTTTTTTTAKNGTIHSCPYRDSRGCTKQYKHRGGVKHHLEQSHKDEPDYRTQISNLSNNQSSKRQRLHDQHQQQFQQLQQSRFYQHQRAQPPPARPLIPQHGMFTHGYLFAPNSQPYRPPNRPIDALYFLNVLSTGGIKTHQARISERLLINSLLNADFIKTLQDASNTGGAKLELVDETGWVAQPERPLRIPGQEEENAGFNKDDVDRAILKIAATLQNVGFGDAVL